jgi:hypothetical protein
METKNTGSKLYWLLPLQALPAVLLLIFIAPMPYLDSYGKLMASVQLFVSCATIPLIISLKDDSFKIWACGAFIIPLPLLIFMERISLDPFLLMGYYLFLTIFLILNYQLRRLKVFIPLLIVSCFGSIIIWGVTEMFAQIQNDSLFYISPILNFFLEVDGKIGGVVFYLIIVSALAYCVYIFEYYQRKQLHNG